MWEQRPATTLPTSTHLATTLPAAPPLLPPARRHPGRPHTHQPDVCALAHIGSCCTASGAGALATNSTSRMMLIPNAALASGEVQSVGSSAVPPRLLLLPSLLPPSALLLSPAPMPLAPAPCRFPLAGEEEEDVEEEGPPACV